MSRLSITYKESTGIEKEFEAAKNLADELWESSGKSKGEFFIDMINSYVSSKKANFSKDDMNIINEAVKLSGESFTDIQKVGTLYRAKYLRTSAKTVKSQNIDTDSLISDLTSKVKGVAESRISNEIERLIEFNKKTNSDFRYRLNKSLISRRVGANRPAINKYFNDNEDMIEKHHEKFDIDSNQNRNRKGDESLPLPEYRT